jgi:hypothetical protein
MQTLFLVCDKCRFELEVEPLETSGYRSISCKNCNAELVFQNSELKACEVSYRKVDRGTSDHEAARLRALAREPFFKSEGRYLTREEARKRSV